MPPLFADSIDSMGLPSSFQGGTYGRRPADAITVTLTSNTSNDQRLLRLEPGASVKIGRSSRSGFRNLPESHDNALFDCPVVSRTHAELHMSSWQKQITIADKSSLHGTSVNGRRLNGQTPFTLKTGDIIKLGGRVARGDDSHDGVSLTFSILNDNMSQNMQSSNSAFPTRNSGFHYPESEHSDFDSDLESTGSDFHERSSAKTTPEQMKVKPGSQEQPIDLEQADPPAGNTIDLSQVEDEDSDDEDAPEVTSARVIPESIDQGGLGNSVTEAIEPLRRTQLPEDGLFVHAQHTLLPEDGLFIDSEDNFSVGEPEYAYEKVPVEFESGAHAQGRAADASFESILSVPRKERYDPVRGSQPPAEDQVESLPAAQAAPKPTLTYTYGPRYNGIDLLSARTDQYDSSRWDVPPALPVTDSFEYQNADTPYNPFLSQGPGAAGLFTKYSTAPTQQQTSSDRPDSEVDAASIAVVLDGTTMPKPNKGKAPLHAILGPAESATAPDADSPAVIDTHVAPQHSNNGKRKASEVDDDEQPTAPPAKRVAAADPISDRPVRVTTSGSSTVAKDVGKYAITALGGAIGGVVGLVAFLNSSYALQLIDYLG